MANARIPGVVGIYSTGMDTGTLARASMPQPGGVGVNSFASPADMEQAKRALAMDIGQLILDITGIFDPSPISDGTNLLISFARGNWVDVVASAVSIVPYIGDLAKTAKLPRYIKSVRQAIHIAKFDPKWADALRTLFAKLKKVLDECIIRTDDLLPDAAKRQLKELKHEIDKFLEPGGGTTTKPPGGSKKTASPSSGSTRSPRDMNRPKPTEKLDKNSGGGYGSNKNNGPRTTKKYKKGEFKTKGLDVAARRKYLESPDGQLMQKMLKEADPGKPDYVYKSRADDLLKSGKDFPTKRTVQSNESLYKLMKDGEKPSQYTPYWLTESELAELRKNPSKIADRLGLPNDSVSPGGKYSVWETKPAMGKKPTIFESTVAPTVEGATSRAGGGAQALILNRQEWQQPVLKSVFP